MKLFEPTVLIFGVVWALGYLMNEANVICRTIDVVKGLL
jgi:hypothetical protein